MNKYLINFFSYRPTLIFVILLALIAIFAIFTPNHSFISRDSVLILLTISPQMVLITLGMGLLLISGEFDLSVGSIYVFSSMIIASLFTNYGTNLFIVLVVAMLIGVGMGTLNGVITTKAKIASLIVTLGTMWAYRGILLILIGGRSIGFYPTGSEQTLSDLFTGKIWGIPLQFIWLLVVTAFLFILLEHTRFGNLVYSTGSNKEAARMMGINTDKVKIICFAILGFLCAFSGLLQVSRVNAAIPQTGELIMLMALAGAVVGGTSLRGGRGNIIGCLFGAFIIQVISLGLVMLGFTEYYTNVAICVVLLTTAYAHSLLTERF